MENNKPTIHHRKSIRLKGYDYSQAGLYFITICCQDRICRFGEIVTVGAYPCGCPTMILNDAGKMVDEQWLAMVKRFPNIELHDYVIMPNHFHCILEIVSMDKIVNSQHVGVPLVGTHFDNDKITIDQPQSISKGRPQSISKGRPQGYAPTGSPRNNAEITTGTPRNNAETTTGSQNDDGIPKNKTIGDMMDAFKSITTVEYIRGVKSKGWDRFKGKIWQRNYYEHIIRDEQSYLTISDYIIKNPEKWKDDKFNPELNTSTNPM